MRMLTTFTFLILFVSPVVAQQFKEGYTASVVLDGLNPVAMTADHHGRIWIAEKNGAVWIVNEEGLPQEDPVIHIDVDEFNERGLMGIVLHPDLDEHPFLYVYYTVPGRDHNRISRFRIQGNFVQPGSEEILLDLDFLSGSIHNGGAMVFDKNDFLFIATGDGAQASNAQQTTNLLGKILRLTDSGEIPNDNPFFGEFQDKNQAIWSLGHRNPFNLAYDYERDILYSSDVGAGNFEEINVVEKGKNYGWPITEGPNQDAFPPENYQDPYFYYNHQEGCAIVGLAYIPENSGFSDIALDDALIYADYCEGYIRYLKGVDTEESVPWISEMERPLNVLFNDHDRSIYILTRAGIGGGTVQDNTTTSDGRLWKINYTGSGAPSVVISPQNKRVPRGEQVRFELSAVGSSPIIYNWYLNDEFFASTDTSGILIASTSNFSRENSLFCIVSNEVGSDTSDLFTLTVIEGSRPKANIINPNSESTYKAGDTISFYGQIVDEEDGLMSEGDMNWSIDFHHDLHHHPFIESINGVDSGSFIIPTVGEPDTNVWVRIHLKGKDSDGLSAQSYVDLFPEFNQLHIRTNFGGKINLDGTFESLPFDLTSTINLERLIEVPQLQLQDSFLLVFSEWENGSTDRFRRFSVNAEGVDTFTIYFDTLRLGTGEGLFAEYFNGGKDNMLGPATLTRIDTMINFKWGEGSPSTGILGENQFAVRWRGFIEPLFTENYKLYFSSDDGARIWLEDELILDDWVNHPPQETIMEFDFISKKRYPITIEYFEDGGGAEAELLWSSQHTPKQYVPKKQLYPIALGDFHARLWYDSNRDSLIQPEEPFISDANVLLLNSKNEILDFTTANADGFFAFRSVVTGQYRILIIPPASLEPTSFGYGLNQAGYSTFFTISSDSITEERYALVDLASFVQGEEVVAVSLTLYPNPVQDQLYIIDHQNYCEEMSVINVNGTIMKKDSNRQPSHSMDLSDLIPGVYFLNCRGKDTILTEKIVKQ